MVENNYTKLPNELVEKLMEFRVPGEQMQILMVIIRKTYGWGKKADWIALNQFVDLTGISKRNVLRAIQALEERKIITVVKNDNKKHPSYRINIKFSQWKSLSKKTPLSKKTISVVKNDNEPLSNSPPTKDTLTKDNNTTTTEDSCGCENNFSEKEAVHQGNEPPAVDSKPDSLSAEEWARKPGWMDSDHWEYIILEGKRKKKNEGFNTTWDAWKSGLIKRAKDGRLNISGLDELRELWTPIWRKGDVSADTKTISEICGKGARLPSIEKVRHHIGNQGLMTDDMERMESIDEIVDAYIQAHVDCFLARDRDEAEQKVLDKLAEEGLPRSDNEAEFQAAWAGKYPWIQLGIKPTEFFHLWDDGRITEGEGNSYVYHLKKMEADRTNRIRIYPDGKVEREKAVVY